MSDKWQAWLSRHKPEVWARIDRLNPPCGPAPGYRVRGYHQTETIRRAFHLDVCTRQQFEDRWGAGSAQRAGRIKAGGRRRWITGMAYVQGPYP